MLQEPYQDQLGDSMQPVAPSDPSGGEVDQLNASRWIYGAS